MGRVSLEGGPLTALLLEVETWWTGFICSIQNLRLMSWLKLFGLIGYEVEKEKKQKRRKHNFSLMKSKGFFYRVRLMKYLIQLYFDPNIPTFQKKYIFLFFPLKIHPKLKWSVLKLISAGPNNHIHFLPKKKPTEDLITNFKLSFGIYICSAEFRSLALVIQVLSCLYMLVRRK